MIATIYSVEELGGGVKSFHFTTKHKLDHLAGQYLDIHLDKGHPHKWFTISSSPTESTDSITTKTMDRHSSFKTKLMKMKPGDTFNFSDVIGDFVLPIDKSVPIIFVAGGIGITPVRSIIKYLTDTKEKRTVEIFYLVRNKQDALFLDILKGYDLTLHVVETSSLKKPIYDFITHTSILLKEKPMTFVSGPQPMVEFLADSIGELIGRENIVMDYFPGYNSL